jgi:hypothetical protein
MGIKFGGGFAPSPDFEILQFLYALVIEIPLFSASFPFPKQKVKINLTKRVVLSDIMTIIGDS